MFCNFYVLFFCVILRLRLFHAVKVSSFACLLTYSPVRIPVVLRRRATQKKLCVSCVYNLR